MIVRVWAGECAGSCLPPQAVVGWLSGAAGGRELCELALDRQPAAAYPTHLSQHTPRPDRSGTRGTWIPDLRTGVRRPDSVTIRTGVQAAGCRRLESGVSAVSTSTSCRYGRAFRPPAPRPRHPAARRPDSCPHLVCASCVGANSVAWPARCWVAGNARAMSSRLCVSSWCLGVLVVKVTYHCWQVRPTAPRGTS